MQLAFPVFFSRARSTLGIVAGLALAGCTMVGPTVAVSPRPGGTAASMATDHRDCMAQTDAALRPISLGPGMTTAKVQVMYNDLYGRCMGAKGNLVASLTPVGTAASGPGGQDDPDSEAARQSLSGVIAENARNCDGERIVATASRVALAPSVPGRIVTLSTPFGGSCFGQPGQNDYLLVKSGSSWRTLLTAEPGSIEVLASRHAGRADVALHSLGMCVYTYRWNGTAYTQAGSRDCATAAPPTLQTLAPAIRRR